MEGLLQRQQIIAEAVQKISTNIKKDPAVRKTTDYAKKRLVSLEALWDEFEDNHSQLTSKIDKKHDYFQSGAYLSVKELYTTTYAALMDIIHSGAKVQPGTSSQSEEQHNPNTEEKGMMSKTDELISQQRTNFRAFSRVVKGIDLERISEKWELQDKLDMIQARWKTVDELHWKIDNLLIGTEVDYEQEYAEYERAYEATKRQLNQKLNHASHQQQTMPKVEIPVFSGNYTQWPTFMDLYSEAIHNNPLISKTQKMQHLKGKLKGEAERLVQHLNISSENYDTCWDILTRRYNNIQLLFTKQIQIFLNQPTVHKFAAHELKRLHDTTLETIHAIHNLGIDTTTWDPILVHILTEKMDPETYSSYMESRKAPRDLPSFDEIIAFLESKFTALEPVNRKGKMANMKTEVKESADSKEFSSKFLPKRFNKQFSPKTYHASSERKCPLCKSDHILIYCKVFQNMAPEAKINTISQLKVCENCLYCHNDKQCNSAKTCKVCNSKHHTTLHDVLQQKPHNTMPANNSTPKGKPISSQHKANHVSGEFKEVLLATVELNVMAMDGMLIKFRALLDQGSQINLITESAAQRLGLHRRKQDAIVSGVGISNNKSHGRVQLNCESIYGNYNFTTEALVMTKLLNNLPNHSFEKLHWPHVENINLADPNYNISRPVDILLDAGVYAEIIMGGILRGPLHAPIAQQTKMGWVLLGNTKTFQCHAVINNLEDISNYWETEEITDDTTTLTSAEEYCENLYTTTTLRKADGRYSVRIPMKQGFEKQLGSSRSQAMAQFKQLETRLSKNKTMAESYNMFMDEYLRLNHMKQSSIPVEPSCYLPHHGVIKLDSTTTKLRVVFNASCKTSSGHSLNELMECGPNLQKDLQALILRWRGFQYVFSADVEKFYRQIEIQEQDQHLQKILWRHSREDPIKEYQLCTVTYGTKAAPFLAMRTIKQLIADDGAQYPLAAEILGSQIYVDDILGGNNDKQMAKTTQQQLIDLLKRGGFNIRKWASNDLRILEDLSRDQISQTMIDFKHAETNKTLGIMWNPCTDQFTFHHQVDLKTNSSLITKRSLLSEISKLYDPLGWLSPATIKAKIIFQQVWTTNIGWDDPVTQDVQKQWEMFREDIKYIRQISLPRWLGDTEKSIQLHGFCDASEKAYACVIYCRSIKSNGEYMTRVVAAKTKLAPIKKMMTLPRLELCGAYLLSRLMKKVTDSLKTHTLTTVHGWTDSMVVLGWLHGDISRWKTFVANRVTKITNTMPPSCWKHVKPDENPADCASRGLFPSQLVENDLWWNAPKWLIEQNIPDHPIEYESPLLEHKVKKQVCAYQTSSQIIEELLSKYDSITRVIRIISWILRIKKTKGEARPPHLTTVELENTYNAVIKHVQSKHFADDITHIQNHNRLHSKSRLLNLNPFLDKRGLLRVGGRLIESDLKNAQKHPIILPHKDRLTELLIKLSHKSTLHGGMRLTLTHLRNKYWILRGVRTVKGHILKCIKCHRYKTTTDKQLMGNLIKPRVTPSRPFTHTGVDFTGQVEVKANKGRGIKTSKAYISIFVCLATKAVHLELVSDLSTAAFLCAFKRFCARRGTPRYMYSDNGTNFVGAAKTLIQEHKEAINTYINTEVVSELANLGIEWNFNAPVWPSAGGLWEAAVKSMKHHLKRVIGEQKLTFEEFSTLIAQVEACLNSRPLVPLTNDVDDLDCLTPAHFLVGGPILSSPLSPDEDIRNIKTRWQLVEKMHKDFWKRWSSEYLQTLQTRSKWHFPTKNLEINDIVLIKEDHLPPSKWLLARVIDTHPGKDGHVRVVTLKTKNGTIKRPIIKLSRLPIEHNEIESESEDRTTSDKPPITDRRPKRKIRAKTSLNSYICTLFLFVCCLCTSLQQVTVNVTTLSASKVVYFDKTADMRIKQDEWRMVVYYNMTTYWRNLQGVENYVYQLNNKFNQETALKSIASQLEHEIKEIQHYNNVLRSEHGYRAKRGLINGVGYAANYLFGTLDQNFAEKYDRDINIVQSNENHLLNLYKQQTSIVEGEYNILKRNEEIMNKQFLLINRRFQETNARIQLERDNALDMMSSAFTASLLIANIRRAQQLLLDLVTDVKDGRVDVHLLKPDQLQVQLNIISGQLPSELSLPCTNSYQCIRQMYKLSRVHVKLTGGFLIFEVKLPLVNREQYELSRIIPIPFLQGQKERRIVPSSEYVAIDLKNNMMMLPSHLDLSTCIHLKNHVLMCALDLPVYDIQQTTAICEAQIINNKNLSACGTTVSSCSDKWIPLHKDGTWLYSCCKQCSIRVFCTSGTYSRVLSANGIIELSPGCMLKSENIMVQSRNKFHSEINVTEDEFYFRESTVNHLISSNNYSFEAENHDTMLKTLKTNIEQVKKHQETLNEVALSHDTHRYVVYGLIVSVIIVAVICTVLKLRKRASTVLHVTTRSPNPNQDTNAMELQLPRDDATSSFDKVNRATSPRQFRN